MLLVMVSHCYFWSVEKRLERANTGTALIHFAVPNKPFDVYAGPRKPLSLSSTSRAISPPTNPIQQQFSQKLCHNTNFTLFHCPTPMFLSKQKQCIANSHSVLYWCVHSTLSYAYSYIISPFPLNLKYVYQHSNNIIQGTYFNSVLNYSVLLLNC